MVKAFKAALILILSSFFLTGCVGKEPNEIAYVVALGIDSGENGNYKITIQYANPTKISGGEEGGSSEESGVEHLDMESSDIYAAVGAANRLDSKTFSLSHTKLIVFSKEIAERGLKDITEVFTRSEELRPDVYFAVSDESAGDYLKSVNPVMEINIAKYYQSVYDTDKRFGIYEGVEKNFFSGVETGDFDMLLPMAINEEENKSGSAVFKGDKMVGMLDEHETEIYKLLSKDFSSGYLTLNNQNKPVTVKTTRQKPPKFYIDENNKALTVNLILEGDIYSAAAGYDTESDNESLNSEYGTYISEECKRLMEKVLHEMDSDIFRLNEHAKLKFLTNEKYEQYKKNTDYREFDITVNVDFKVSKTGLTLKGV